MRRPKIAQTSWIFCKDSIIMVLHFKFKCQLRWCYLWSFSTSIMLQTFQYFDIFLHLVCFRNGLQRQDILLFQAEISSRFSIISLQPDRWGDKRTVIGSAISMRRKGLPLFRNAVVIVKAVLKKDFLYLHLSQWKHCVCKFKRGIFI